MNRRIGRKYLVATVTASTLAIAAACAAPNTGAARVAASGHPNSSPRAAVVPTPPAAYVPGGPTVTDGSADVVIEGKPVRFGSTVTDGAWSPDGSRIAYVDGNGNIATAGADGTRVVVLTRTDAKVKRAHPTWRDGGMAIEYAERDAGGVWRLYAVTPDDGLPAHLTGSKGRSGPSDAQAGEIETWVWQLGTKVQVADGNQRTQGQPPVSTASFAGTSPALAPDARTIAYVGTGGQIFTRRFDGSKVTAPVQVTFGVAGIRTPAWSPDGSRIAFSTARDVESVSAHPASRSNPPRPEWRSPGTPTYRSGRTAMVARIDTADPVAAAITVASRTWSSGQRADRVYLVAVGDLAAMAAVRNEYGPVLLTGGDALDPRVASALARFGPHGTDGGVTVVGDGAHMKAAVVNALDRLGYTTESLQPVPPAPTYMPDPGVPVWIVADDDPAALGSGRVHDPLAIVVHAGTLTSDQAAELTSLSTRDHGATEVRLVGAGARQALAEWGGRPALRVVDEPDDVQGASIALAAPYAHQVMLVSSGDYAAQLLAGGQPYGCATLVVDPGDTLSPAAVDWLSRNAAALDNVTAIGTAGGVPDALLAYAGSLIAGPGGAVRK